MASTSLWFEGRGGWLPEDEEIIRRVRARKDCPKCHTPQVVEDGACIDCGHRGSEEEADKR